MPSLLVPMAPTLEDVQGPAAPENKVVTRPTGTPREIAQALRNRQLELDYGTQDVTKAAQLLALEAMDEVGKIMREGDNKPATRLAAAKIIIDAAKTEQPTTDAADMTDAQIEERAQLIMAQRAQKRLGAGSGS